MPTEPATGPTAARPPGRPWSLSEAADYLGVSERTITRMADAGRIRLLRIGTGRGRVLVPDSEIQRLAESGCDRA
jgi:excisionase family DNA binding protein